METQIIDLDLPTKISTNKIYSGTHWTERKKLKDLYVWNFLIVASKIKPIDRCELEFEFEFKNKPLDCDNCSFMAKLLVDCLRHYQKLIDDTPKYLSSIKISSKKGKKDKVRIIINGFDF